MLHPTMLDDVEPTCCPRLNSWHFEHEWTYNFSSDDKEFLLDMTQRTSLP